MPGENEKIFLDADDEQYQAKEAKEAIRVLVFCLGKEYYGIDVRSAKEVFWPNQITRVPTAPDFIKGLTNLRGQVISLIDISSFLGIAAAGVSGAVQVIALDFKNNLFGMIVDKIEGIFEIEKVAIQPPLATLKVKLLDFTVGQVEFGKGILAILDLEKIINLDEFKGLKGRI